MTIDAAGTYWLNATINSTPTQDPDLDRLLNEEGEEREARRTRPYTYLEVDPRPF